MSVSTPINPSKTICFDLDGTLCTNTGGSYEDAEPFSWAIKRVNRLAKAGHRIVIFTARGSKTGIDWTSLTRGQLERWNVHYDELVLGKPSADVYVDDRTVTTEAWRWGDAFRVPGFPGMPGPGLVEELPVSPPSYFSTIVEMGAPTEAAEVAERLIGRARAAGFAVELNTTEITSAIRAAIEAVGVEVIFVAALSDRPDSRLGADIDRHPLEIWVRPADD